MGSKKTVQLEIEAGVAWLTLDRPERRNAFTHAMWHDFLAALEEVLASEDARVLVVAGAGGNFTAGADMEVLEEGAEGRPPDHGPHPFARVMDLFLGDFDKPVIAAVEGVAVGFGLTMLLHCDFVYVSSSARLRAPFVRLGLPPEAASSFLFPEVLGVRRAAELLYTADFIEGARALELGIANACVPPSELFATARATANRIAENPPGAVRETKRLLLEGRRDSARAAIDRENAAFVRCMGTPENEEAIRAFREKRPPDFSSLRDSRKGKG